MSNDVDIKFAGDSKSVQKALDQMQAKFDRLERRLEKMQKVSKQFGGQTKTSFDQGTGAIGRMGVKLGGMMSLMTIFKESVRAVGREWEDTVKKQEAAYNAVMEPAEAIAGVKLNFVPDKTLSRKNLEGEVLKLAEEIHQPVAQVARSLAGVLSAKGDLTAMQGFELVRQAGRLKIMDPDFNSQIAESAGDIAKRERIEDPRILLGSLINMQAAARPKQLDKLGKNLLPGIIAMRNFGFTFEQAAELGATITQLSGDSEGEQTGTALPGFAQKLKDFVPKRATKGKFRGQYVASDARGEFTIPDEQVAAFEKAMAESPNDIFGIFQKSPELRRAFEKELSGSLRAKVRQPFISVLRGDKEAIKVFKNSQKIINPLGSTLGKMFEEQVAFQGSGEIQATSEAKHKMASNLEISQLKDVHAQRFEVARQALTKTLENIDRPGIDFYDNWVQKNRLNTTFRMMEGKLAEGKTTPAPELVAANILEGIATKKDPKSTFAADMSASHVEMLKKQIAFLKEEAEKRGDLVPAQKSSFFSKVSKQFFGGDEKTRDPQMDEQTQLLRQIAEQGKDSGRPVVTQRKTAKLSRGNN